MVTDQQYVFAEYWNRSEYPTFREYRDAQIETLVFFLQDAADNHWNDLLDQMDGASIEEIGAAMQRWWNGHIRRFHAWLRSEQERERRKQDRRRVRGEERCRVEAEAEQLRAEVEKELEAVRAELHETKVDLEIERGLTATLKERWYCRECYSKRWEGWP